jgi:hypothetical protein
VNAWTNAIRRVIGSPDKVATRRPQFPPAKIDWSRLVTLDFETYFDQDYTLKKLTTSEYIRDPRFKAHMVGIKIGNRATKVVPTARIQQELNKIDWTTHSVLCHHTQFDGFILQYHYRVIPKFYYCTLSMARGWLANDIGAGLDEVAQYFGRGAKHPNVLDMMRGVHTLPAPLYKTAAAYCANDCDMTLDIFREDLAQHFPQSELDLIDVTCQMFCCPVLCLDEKRATTAMLKEIDERETLLLSVTEEIETDDADAAFKSMPSANRRELIADAGASWTPRQLRLFMGKKIIGSSDKFAQLLRDEGVEPPMKATKKWIGTPVELRDDSFKWGYAFAKDDLAFIELGEDENPRIRALVETRLAVKSNINITRAGRLLESGKGGRPMPVYYKYAGAHTWRFSGGDGQNWQNFTRGGELRLSIRAPKDHVLAVADSSQIEVRVNAWLWGQTDLLDVFAANGDPYSTFASMLYGRPITKADKNERQVGKTAVLGLGFQMGAEKFKGTLARGVGGPPVFVSLEFARAAVNTYRRQNYKIKQGWATCERIIADMRMGRTGSHKCISWEKETIWLPNGMRLKYPNLRVNKEGETGYDRKGHFVKLYGGILCENIVQALARIIVAADQLLSIAKRYPVVMTTHDEVVVVVKLGPGESPSFTLNKPEHHAELAKLKGPAAEAMRLLHRVMTQPPEWCKDIPLSAEGGFALEYSK